MMPSFLFSFRTVTLACALFCAGLMGFALYLEHVQGLEPCPLCMLQRFALISMGGVFAVAAVHNPSGVGRFVYALAALATALLGALLASRQLWLQSLPADQVPACGPSFDYMVQAFPLSEVLLTALRGTGDCAKVVWTFLGLSIPGWTLLNFIGFALVSAWLAVRFRPGRAQAAQSAYSV